jgi:hypothetical protein
LIEYQKRQIEQLLRENEALKLELAVAGSGGSQQQQQQPLEQTRGMV